MRLSRRCVFTAKHVPASMCSHRTIALSRPSPTYAVIPDAEIHNYGYTIRAMAAVNLNNDTPPGTTKTPYLPCDQRFDVHLPHNRHRHQSAVACGDSASCAPAATRRGVPSTVMFVLVCAHRPATGVVVRRVVVRSRGQIRAFRSVMILAKPPSEGRTVEATLPDVHRRCRL